MHIDLSRIYFLLLAIFVSTPTLHRYASAEETGHVAMQPLDAEREKRFLAAVFKKELYVPPVVSDVTPEKEVKYLWLGNKPSMTSQLSEVDLTLSRPQDGGAAQEFNLGFKFMNGSVIVNHDRLKNQAPVKLAFKPTVNQLPLNIEGRDGTSLVVFVPRFAPDSPSRGVMFCPRDLPETLAAGEAIKIVDRGYSLTKAQFKSVDGDGEAKLLSGINPGYAEALLLTTPNVRRSESFRDVAYAKDPAVNIYYTPDENDQVDSNITDPNIVGGISVQVTLQVPSGNQRVSTASSRIWVKKVEADSEIKLAIPLRRIAGTKYQSSVPPNYLEAAKSNPKVGITMKLGMGGCYIVLAETSPILNQYSKEPLRQGP